MTGASTSNERLRDALLRKGFSQRAAAHELEVNPKTVERWITKGRMPHPQQRFALADLVGESETYLWPDTVGTRPGMIAGAEIVAVYPHRQRVPVDVWNRLTENASRHIDIVTDDAVFLTEDPALPGRLRTRAAAGAQVRVLVGEPGDSDNSLAAAKARATRGFFAQVADTPGVEVRSRPQGGASAQLYRFDDQILVTTPIAGVEGAHCPVLHLRQLDGGSVFDSYTASIDTVWGQSDPTMDRRLDRPERRIPAHAHAFRPAAPTPTPLAMPGVMNRTGLTPAWELSR